MTCLFCMTVTRTRTILINTVHHLQYFVLPCLKPGHHYFIACLKVQDPLFWTYPHDFTSTYLLFKRERHFLFNDALNTFYLRLYGVRHMVKDHSDIEKRNPLLPHRLLLSINSKGSFICTNHGLYYTSRGALAGTRNSSMGLLFK